MDHATLRILCKLWEFATRLDAFNVNALNVQMVDKISQSQYAARRKELLSFVKQLRSIGYLLISML